VARIVAVGHVGLNARDLAGLARFYREIVGLRQLTYHEGVIAIFAVGDTPTDLFLMPGAPDTVEFDLATGDVDDLRARLLAAKVECTEARDEKRSGHRSFSFVDPEGHRIQVSNAHTRT